MKDIQNFIECFKGICFFVDLEFVLLVEKKSQLCSYFGIVKYRNFLILVCAESLIVKFKKCSDYSLKLAQTVLCILLIKRDSIMEVPSNFWKLPQSLKTHVNETI
jgi:hypothetical protein